MVRFGSFNVFGMGGKDITPMVASALIELPVVSTELSAIAFQEVWFNTQLSPILDSYIGVGRTITDSANVRRCSVPGEPWKCLIPIVPRVPKFFPGVPELELSSGLALLIRGAIEDSFFSLYRGGEIPDSISNKGFLAALVRTPGQPKRAVVATHLHDYSNDAFGRARNNHLDVIRSGVRWIRNNWRVPIVLLGDFNIDSIRAYAKTDTVERTLYSDLVRSGLDQNQAFFDVNARTNGLTPKPTNAAGRAIDHHLVFGENASAGSFRTVVTPSDHLLTESSW